MAETSAAARVLALPELLERILLNLNWRELFKILRTNKSFHDTMMGSIHLRRRMHLEYKLPSDKQDIQKGLQYQSQSFFNDLNVVREIEVGSYALYQKSERTHLVRTPLTIAADTAYQHGGASKMNRRLQLCKLFGDDVSHSWRAMKLTHLREPVSFEIRARGGWGNHLYDEVIEFKEGQGTLGQIMDAIDHIRRRSRNQHHQRRKELEEERGTLLDIEKLCAGII